MADVSFSGRVTRLYPDRGGAYIQLDEGTYYYLLLNHENYDAIFSMAMSAAINGVSFTIRITGGKSASGHDLVEYATMNFPLPN
ncbi:MAG: hypothetical protein ACK5LU_17885 [Pseudanabaena sp.]|jgi:hypothetical protein